ncbi:hypothetical protein LCGC14_1895760, partial [marine sediment metagenome]
MKTIYWSLLALLAPVLAVAAIEEQWFGYAGSGAADRSEKIAM